MSIRNLVTRVGLRTSPVKAFTIPLSVYTQTRSFSSNNNPSFSSSKNSPESSSKLMSRIAKAATSTAINTNINQNKDVAEAFEASVKEQLDTVQWIQELLDKTEGGGYIVSNAGLLGHDIFWGDMDTFSHVNNVMYLKWFETARVNFFKQLGQVNPEVHGFMDGIGVGPIIRSVELAWRYPITFPDTITVVHKFEPLTEPDRFVLKGVVISHNAKKVASRIKEVIVTVDYANGGVKAPIPEPVKDVIKQQYDLQYNL